MENASVMMLEGSQGRLKHIPKFQARSESLRIQRLVDCSQFNTDYILDHWH
jgi:hypothetical protein